MNRLALLRRAEGRGELRWWPEVQDELVTDGLRQALAASVDRLIPDARLKLQVDPNVPWDQLNRWKQGAVLREAVRRALVEHGILRIRRKRFSPPITTKKASGIT